MIGIAERVVPIASLKPRIAWRLTGFDTPKERLKSQINAFQSIL